MTSDQTICYSLGKNKYDNRPKQVIAGNFSQFQNQILSYRSSRKGETYFTSGFSLGAHDNPEKYPGVACYRLKKLALPRRFIPFDFDGFDGPDTYREVMQFFESFRGFGYETWSHSTSAPRARVVLELDRPATTDESERLGAIIEAKIDEAVGEGLVKYDKCVYQLQQPIYAAPALAKDYDFNGTRLQVDGLLAETPLANKGIWISSSKYISNLEINNDLIKRSPPPDESPRQIARLKNMLSFINADCDYQDYRRIIWAILSTEWKCAQQIAFEWSMTAPNRFNERTFTDLVNGFKSLLANRPTVGTIKYLAEIGGWDE